jgi:archaeal type IV pilus assembly protein PilA
MEIVKKDDAVSPVIGVILMVAITVILAAVIAAFVFGMAGNVQTSKNVGLQVSAPNATGLDVLISGGTDLGSLNYMALSIAGAPVTVPAEWGSATTSATFVVGEIITTNSVTGGSSGKRVIITGTFKDGGTQVLYDKTM